MLSFFRNRSVMPFAIGAALAATVGVLLGASMQPNLEAGAPTGPRTMIAGGGARVVPVLSDPGVAAYKGRVPDYVVGSDWTQPPALEPEPELVDDYEPVAYEPVVAARAERPFAIAPRAELVRMPVSDIDRPNVVVFPSTVGGVVHESDLPAAPAPPEDIDPG